MDSSNHSISSTNSTSSGSINGKSAGKSTAASSKKTPVHNEASGSASTDAKQQPAEQTVAKAPSHASALAEGPPASKGVASTKDNSAKVAALVSGEESGRLGTSGEASLPVPQRVEEEEGDFDHLEKAAEDLVATLASEVTNWARQQVDISESFCSHILMLYLRILM